MSGLLLMSEVPLNDVLVCSSLTRALPPRQSVGRGKSIQKRVRTRFSLLKITALRGKLTFGDLFEDSGVASTPCLRFRRRFMRRFRKRNSCPSKDGFLIDSCLAGPR
jgi:hypothetical protein